jgi:hypothetical protein
LDTTDGVEQSNGAPFEVLAPDARMMFVSSKEQIKELDGAPDSVLSLNGAAKHVGVPQVSTPPDCH